MNAKKILCLVALITCFALNARAVYEEISWWEESYNIYGCVTGGTCQLDPGAAPDCTVVTQYEPHCQIGSGDCPTAYSETEYGICLKVSPTINLCACYL